MKHPTSRCERRAVRDLYISRRKFILVFIQKITYGHKIPHIGQEREFLEYMKYVRWNGATDDEKKIMEVEYILDHPEKGGWCTYPGNQKGWSPAEPVQGWWRPPVWGKYSKFNLVPNCNCCCKSNQWSYPKEQRKRREQLKRDIVENLESYE
jgi:hypothetical protein